MPERIPNSDDRTGLFDAARVIDIAREAGRILLDHRADFQARSEPVASWRKADGSAVTQADINSNHFLIESLSKMYPGIKVVSEEQDEAINEGIINEHSTYWMIDPLDNTTRYIDGKPEFSINIALVVEGKPTYGVLFFPAMDLLYFTDGNGQSFKIEKGDKPEALRVPQSITPNSKVNIAAKKEDSPAVLIAPFLKRGHPFFNIINSYGQHRPCLVAEGIAASCSQRGGYLPWDVAATAAIIEGAGGMVKDEKGQDLNFSSLDSLPPHFVAGPDIMKMLLSHPPQSAKQH